MVYVQKEAVLNLFTTKCVYFSKIKQNRSLYCLLNIYLLIISLNYRRFIMSSSIINSARYSTTVSNSSSKTVDTLLRQSAKQLLDYTKSFQSYFTSSTRQVTTTAHHYIQGLFKTEKKKGTCTGMSKVLEKVGSQNLNHLLNGSPWYYDEVMSQVMRRSNSRLKDHEDTCIQIDEFSFSKKGKKSVGVAHQYLGCLGKKANGQVAVGLTHNQAKNSSLINSRLFLPKSWTSDKARMVRAGVPDEHQSYQTKLEIALDLVDEAIKNGVYFNWLNMDSLYGRSLDLLAKLEIRGLTFSGDIPKNMLVYKEEPILYIPAKKSGRGRANTRLVTDSKPITVDNLREQLQAKDWKIIAVRHATKGDVLIEGFKQRVWLWDKNKTYCQSYILFIKKPINYDDQISYSLLNVKDEVPLKRIAFMQGQRFFIEHTYKEGKNQVGLGDYQVRSWQAFHRHIALCMMALNFLMEIRMDAHRLDFHWFTAADVKELLCFLIPDKKVTLDDLIQQLKAKHNQYQKEIDRNRRKTKLHYQLE